MNAAEPHEIKDLAAKSKTSVGHLYHLKLGNRVAGPELAKRIEQASVPIAEKSEGRLGKLTRVGLCPACCACEYAKQFCA